MKQFKDLNDFTVTNTMYANFVVVYDPQELFTMVSPLQAVTTNMNVSLEEFMDELVKYEEENCIYKNKGTRFRYGAIVTIMVNQNNTSEQLVKLSNKIAEYYGDLPYYSFYQRQGKGHYLVMYFSERYYYPEGVKQTFQHDIYKDKVTGKICNKDNPNALLIHYKGEEKENSQLQYFSFKVDTFKSITKKSYLRKIYFLKDYLVDVFSEIFQMIIEEAITFGKYVIKNLNIFERKGASIWNNTIREVEDSFNRAYVELKEMKLVNETTMTKFLNLFRKYKTILKNRSFKVSGVNRIFKLPISFTDTNTTSEFVDKCESDICEFMQEAMQ